MDAIQIADLAKSSPEQMQILKNRILEAETVAFELEEKGKPELARPYWNKATILNDAHALTFK
jgi:hypothetical protein